jgi:hypothetical protein
MAVAAAARRAHLLLFFSHFGGVVEQAKDCHGVYGLSGWAGWSNGSTKGNL